MNKKCGIILFDEKKQSYLLVFGKKSQKWGFPKGHMEVGETTKETAIREFYEETGFTLNNVTFDNTFIIKNNTYFVIHINDEKRHLIQKANYIPDTKEIQFFEWIPKQNMLNMDILSCNFGLKAYINSLKRQPEFSEKLRPLLAVQINK